jgi:GNAT superfamily N-acetyltransferase
LMLLQPLPADRPESTGARILEPDELELARRVITDSFDISPASARTAVPDSIVGSNDIMVWGLFDDERLVTAVAVVEEDGLAVIWSMATLRDSQARGYGRRLIAVALYDQFEKGATGSLLYSSESGESLYRGLGYESVEYIQMWSRPRWVLGMA